MSTDISICTYCGLEFKKGISGVTWRDNKVHGNIAWCPECRIAVLGPDNDPEVQKMRKTVEERRFYWQSGQKKMDKRETELLKTKSRAAQARAGSDIKSANEKSPMSQDIHLGHVIIAISLLVLVGTAALIISQST